jgi:RNA exonuclease 1
MCETADPVTGDRESTLIRVSVVNGYNPDEVLLDTLVTPLLPIVDLRTRIHGITEEQLASVKVTLRHVQATVLTLMNDQTIILGHSVYNDLKALHLNHG